MSEAYVQKLKNELSELESRHALAEKELNDLSSNTLAPETAAKRSVQVFAKSFDEL